MQRIYIMVEKPFMSDRSSAASVTHNPQPTSAFQHNIIHIHGFHALVTATMFYQHFNDDDNNNCYSKAGAALTTFSKTD